MKLKNYIVMFVLNFVPVKRKCLILIQEQHRWMFMWRDMNLMEKVLFLERNKETGKKISKNSLSSC